MGKKQNKLKLARWGFGGGCGGVLGLLVLALLCPVQTPSAAAEAPDTSAFKAEVATKTSVKAYATISVAVDSEINLELTPRSQGSFSSGVANVTVGTNNTTGYAMYLRTLDGSQSLNAADTKNTSKLGAIDGTLTATNYASNAKNRNTWGYALTRQAADNTTEYRAIPRPGDGAIGSSTGTASADQYHLNIGAVVDPSLPAGEYRNSLILSVVANPVTITGFKSIYYMQEMTPLVCESATEGEEGELVDQRDNTIYQVAKLKDGNCWMTQNLALNLSPAQTFTSDDTDLVAGGIYTPNTTTNAVNFNGTPNDGNGNVADGQNSWNFGKVVQSTPLSTKSCSNYGSIDGAVNSAASNDKLGEVCKNVGFIDVSEGNWKANYHSTDGQTAISGDAYDPHYLIGNYYQYNAATAGTGSDAIANNTNATSSICPKGWRLPESGANSDGTPLAKDNTASFYNLLLAYGYPAADNYTIGDDNVAHTALKHDIGQDNLTTRPFYFVRAGGVNLAYGYITNLGSNAYYWSSTAWNSGRAYRLFISSGLVRPSAYLSRAIGMSVRCVAK